MRESAYEILLACMAFSGILSHSFDNQKKDKSSRFLSGLKSRKDRRHSRSQSADFQFEHIDTIRVQMQISEAMDTCVRQWLMQFASRKASVKIDVLQISLDLLHCILKSDFLNERSYTQWRKRQVKILEELFSSVKNITSETQIVETELAKIRNLKEWDITPAERAEVLLVIRQVASILSSVHRHFNIQGQTSYWAACYHLNIRLYEKLLFGIFDILEESQLIEESEEFLKLIKLTWSTLGITQKMHDALYAWVLFQQFVGTNEVALLDHAIAEVHKVLSTTDNKEKEELYMNNLMCTIDCNGSETRLCLVQAIFWSINLWCDNKLQDYHLHFSQKPAFFRRVVTMGLAVGTYDSGKCGEIKLTNSDAFGDAATKVRMYVNRSIEAAYSRVADTLDLVSKIEKKHPLALLASELRLISDREITVFCPILCHVLPDAGMLAAKLLHQFYGQRLKPFLDGISELSEDVRSVLSMADILEHDLTRLYSFKCKENGLSSPLIDDFDHYQVREICRPIILDWLISQHARILEWTGRAFNIEVWEPLSYQQKQAASAVEVFRIIEETVDRLFELSLPMDILHLQALLSIIFHTLDGYLLKLNSQLVEKDHLYPAAPPLTRYKETVFPIIKKKVVEFVLLEEDVNDKLNELTVPKLCVRLNTLQYIQKQVGALEDGIRKSWASVWQFGNTGCADGHPETSTSLPTSSESVDELFVATFDTIRSSAADAIRKICDLTGTRVVFWDLRDPFLFHLYRGTVEGARLDSILPHFDSVLNRICDLIDDTLRDLLVTSICRASLEGFLWVLLDGGPACSFSDSDVTMIEDDLNMLKELFVADGEGLPRSLVDVEAKLSHQILSLFSLPSESVIQMLMTASAQLSTGFGSSSSKHRQRCLEDADTLIRVLCHKKDREASKFLKLHYHLPVSSEYDDPSFHHSSTNSPVIPSTISPAVADLIRSASSRWNEKGHSSFKSLRKKFHEVQGGSFRWT